MWEVQISLREGQKKTLNSILADIRQVDPPDCTRLPQGHAYRHGLVRYPVV
jgi:hypothetical protein